MLLGFNHGAHGGSTESTEILCSRSPGDAYRLQIKNREHSVSTAQNKLAAITHGFKIYLQYVM